MFLESENYCGSPDMLQTRLLREVVETALAAEVEALPEAVWIPLGPQPVGALKHLARQGCLSTDRILEGVPHPSGANAERISYFLGRKKAELPSPKTNAAKIDQARDSLKAAVSRLGRR